MKASFSVDRPVEDSPAGRNTLLGIGCLVAFLLPFGMIGAWTVMLGVRQLGQGSWLQAAMLCGFGLVFGGFAAGGMYLLAVGWRKLKEQSARKAAHPDEPWLWEPEWASGRINDSSRGTLWTSWAFAAFWNLVSVPVGYLGLQEAIHKGNHAAFVALLFPVAGAGILVWAIRSTLRYTKYGVSRLELDTLPGTIGRTLGGAVRVSGRFESDLSFDAVLTCISRVTTGGGKNSSTSEKILWQDEAPVRGAEIRDVTGPATRIPIQFRIPSDARPSDSTNSRNRIIWRLKLSASVPGVDYESVFEVPVFRTAESELPLPDQEDQAVQNEAALLAGYRQPPGSRISVTRTVRGTEIVFPAGRNPGVTVGSTIFTLVWAGIVAGLLRWHAPLIFPIFFSLFGLILLYATINFWLMVSRVVVSEGKIIVAEGYLTTGRERTFASSELTDVVLSIGMQNGQRPYYDIVLTRTNGRKVTAGRWVRDKREAEWLAATIRNALGLLGRRSEVSARHDG